MSNLHEKANQHVRDAINSTYQRNSIAANLGGALIYTLLDGIDAYRERTEIMKNNKEGA